MSADLVVTALAALLASAVEPMALLAPTGRVLGCNGAMGRFLGVDAASTKGRSLFDLVHPRHRPALEHHWAWFARGNRASDERTLRVAPLGEASRRVRVKLTDLAPETGLEVLALALRDDERAAAAEDRLLSNALTDRTTGLPRRAAFLDRIARSAQGAGPSAIIVVAFAGPADPGSGLRGPGPLQRVTEAAERIRDQLQPGEVLGRLDDDRFGILLPGATAEAALRCAQLLRATFRKPLVASGEPVRVDPTFGLALLPGGSSDPEEGLRRASLACRVASGETRTTLYTPEREARYREEQRLEGELGEALELGQMRAHLQPIVDLATGRPRSLEALVRWDHPRRGLLGAGEFVPTAERSELIVDLGWWMLDHICALQGERRRRRAPTLPIHVNVAPAQIATGELVSRVESALSAHDCPPHLLHVEVTESATALSPVEMAKPLRHLRRLQVGCSIDDFGTGHSSLAHLHRFPASMLKIDRSFVTGIERRSAGASLVRAIVAVARELRMSVVAEGIETAAEAAVVRELGCHMGQGYLYGRPADVENLDALIGTAP